jgi:hypothetical protein
MSKINTTVRLDNKEALGVKILCESCIHLVCNQDLMFSFVHKMYFLL